MTQASPSILLYGQALVLVKELTDAYNAGVIKTSTDIDIKIKDILTRYQSGIGSPITEWNPVVETEPPLSSKMNKFWRQIQSDIALMQHQVDLLKSSAVFVHNALTIETQKAAQQNAVLRNKIKTLQLYSDSVDNNIITFGDQFHTNEYIDEKFVASEFRTNIEAEHFLTLGKQGEYANLAAQSSVKILEESNGFPGNNQEVKNPVSAPQDPTVNAPLLTFVAESHRAHRLNALLDDSPSTWFEYESWQVSDQDKQRAKSLNFSYRTDTASGSEITDWSLGPDGSVLRLGLEFNLGSSQKINQITYIPYGLTDNVNLPVHITSVEISFNGTVWSPVYPTSIWVGTDVNLNAARVADDIVTRKAIWAFQEQTTQFIRIHIEQPNSISRPAGHQYWVDKNNTTQRLEGPIPHISNLERSYSPSNRTSGSLLQKREWFNARRWAIGIRDISFEQIRYNIESTMVSHPIRVGGTISRVSLDADVYIPPSFGSDTEWVRFYVSPDDGTTWYQISKIQDDFLNIPEIIAFNDPTPEAFRENGVAYYDVGGEVTAVRLKIVLTRPDDLPDSSPLVRSYKIKLERR